MTQSGTRPARTLRSTGRRAAVAALMAVTAASACSTDPESSRGTTTSAAPTSTDAPTSTTVGGADGAFAVPDALAAAVAASAHPFTPVTYPAQPTDVPWPTTAWPRGELAGEVGTAVDAIVERAFGELSDDTDHIDAVLVVQGGKLVVERYNGWDPEATHNSWSMAKSINSALVGILVGQGRIDITRPFDAPEWREPGDPRASITWDQLLRMSSGLEWEEDYEDPAGDVLRSLGPDNDRGGYTASKPLADEPGRTFEYSTGTANLLARGVADLVGHGDAMTAWIDEQLLAPLGIPKVTHNLDRTGVTSGGSFFDLRPQDFARFGLLYLRDGMWDGRRILPEGWVDYSRMPTPSDPAGEYGAQWWLMPDRPGVFYASGFNGQSITVAPEQDLVVVVLSKVSDDRDEKVRVALLDALGV